MSILPEEEENPNAPPAVQLKNMILKLTNQHQQSQHHHHADEQSNNGQAKKYRLLRIIRTYRDLDDEEDDDGGGHEYTKVELVKKPILIDAYCNIRNKKDDVFVRNAFNLTEIEKEKLKREKKRLQEQLKKVKRTEAAEAAAAGKVRKYNRQPKQPLQPGEVRQKRPYRKSNQTATPNSGQPGDGTQPPVREKRKYVRRKKPDGTPINPEMGELSKVEGTKLIIKKKAMELIDSSSPVKKKYRKQPKTPAIVPSSSVQSQPTFDIKVVNPVDENTDQTADPGEPKVAPKLRIVMNKPKEMSTTLVEDNKSSVQPTTSTEEMNTSNTATSASNTPQTAPKRQYNKQSAMLKKQQKQQQMLLLQQQQSQLMDQSQQSPLVQFANFFDQQQLLMALAAVSSPAVMAANMMFPFGFPMDQPQTPQQASNVQPQQAIKRRQSTASSQNPTDYLTKPHKKVDRRHADPLVTFSSVLENILNELRDLPEVMPLFFYTQLSFKTINLDLQGSTVSGARQFKKSARLLQTDSESDRPVNNSQENKRENVQES